MFEKKRFFDEPYCTIIKKNIAQKSSALIRHGAKHPKNWHLAYQNEKSTWVLCLILIKDLLIV